MENINIEHEMMHPQHMVVLLHVHVWMFIKITRLLGHLGHG